MYWRARQGSHRYTTTRGRAPRVGPPCIPPNSGGEATTGAEPRHPPKVGGAGGANPPQEQRMAGSRSYSLSAARGLADQLAGLEPGGPPRARLLRAPVAGLGTQVGVLAGSFDPLTAAHAALARAALRHGGLDSLLW